MSRASELILKIEMGLTQVQKEYNQFLGGATPVEPWEAREKLLRQVKILRNLTKMKTEEMFRADNLIAKVQSYVSLWERQSNQKMGQKRPRKVVKEAPQPKESFRPGDAVRIADVARDRSGVVQLYDEYTRNNLLLGVRDQLDFSRFNAFLKQQTEKIKQKRHASHVAYQIVVKDQKVLIKSKALK